MSVTYVALILNQNRVSRVYCDLLFEDMDRRDLRELSNILVR